MANESTGTGVEELDRALDGLYWGDNVVWVWESGERSSQELFYDAIAQRREDFGRAGYVVASTDPAEVKARWPWLEIIDARKGSPAASPRQLLEAVHQFCVRAPRPLLLFDSLAPLADRWGMRIASGFFGHCCPMLLDLGAIAYWSVPGASQFRSMHREIEQITQCIIVVGEGRLRISKAEGRPPGAQGQLFRYSVKDGGLQLQPAQAAARVGSALRAYRLRRDLSQSDLARLAGVSPSAISQVERGERGLSLETLMALSGRLNVTLDELLGGEVTPDYRIGRRHGLGDASAGSVLPLLDDAETGMRAYLVSLPRSATVEAPFAHKGAELVGVVSGLVQVLLSSGRPVLRRGETLLASRRGIDGWRNMGESDAQCLWVLRD
ncbi:MAG TPA: helix-turn-helix domain-containing protein [Streptosporangiaceae bacterium]|nr:helix-turn-helix domain-containing protein [Streptosporangiaceae bacterium]